MRFSLKVKLFMDKIRYHDNNIVTNHQSIKRLQNYSCKEHLQKNTGIQYKFMQDRTGQQSVVFLIVLYPVFGNLFRTFLNH